MVLVGIPLFAFAFCALSFLQPGPFGIPQWLVATVGGYIAWKVGVLLVERLVYRFVPTNGGDA
jgi:hypothetical protein